MKCLVLGAGVVGLTSALALQDAGHDVTVWAAEWTPHTTSDCAGGLWFPYKSGPPEKVERWAMATHVRLLDLMVEHPSVGVDLVKMLMLHRGTPPPDDAEVWYRKLVFGFRRAAPAELPPGFDYGIAFKVALVNMDLFMEWLIARFRSRGGHTEQRRVTSLDDAYDQAAVDLLVNCTGTGASTLCHDPDVFPIRGQLVVLEKQHASDVAMQHTAESHGGALPASTLMADASVHGRHEPLTTAYMDEETLTYAFPWRGVVVCGGCAVDGDWNRAVDHQLALDIHRRAVTMLPHLAPMPVVAHRVGLRPGRSSGVRLELCWDQSGRAIIHNYGHGGSGVTLSFGCADEVEALAKRVYWTRKLERPQ